MSTISRRTLLKGMGAGTLGMTLGSYLVAGASVARGQDAAPTPSAFYRLNVGDFQVTVIQDATGQLPSTALGTNAPEGAADELLAENNLPTGTLNNTFNVTVVNTGDRVVLLDTGLGRSLIPTLGLLGVMPEDVTDVIITHFHPDHVGGVAGATGPNFPNAMHYISQIEFDLIQGGATGSPLDQLIDTAAGIFQPLMDAGQFSPYASEAEVVPGIQAVAALGHTPGHHAMLVGSADSQLLVTADTAIHYLVALAHPEWYLGFDAIPDMAVESRRALFQRAVDEQLRIAAYHFPFPGVGYVDTDGEGFRFLPAL